ncbi:hypothetical protein CK203_108891 [Vitis vinifera]|uniref:Ubiquitin-like protease family profile domain-containing protein n=1 Tax=Vitis vinifera TaxID=29760 RepID=A0A438CS57_VITVI|nr:hypothetical protein CK203_108891 [Vitis vinifera]
MNLRLNAYSPRINEWGDDEVSRMKRKIKTLGGYDDPKVTIWIIKIGQSVDIEQNNGAENENDEKMKVVEKDERISDHKDNDMRNVEDGDNKMPKVHEQQEEGHKVNVDVPYVEKQEEQLSSLVVLPRQLKKTRSTMERKPSKFKVSPYIHQSNKMPKPKRFPSIVVGSQKIIPMSILPNVEDSHSLSTLESLVVAYVFDVSLDKSELLVNFQYEHASRADFLTLGPRQELLDVIINVFACKLNSFENKFKGIRLPDATYPPHLRYIYIPMHDTCPDHWYLCVINLHQHNIHILDSLPSIERDDMRTSSVRTVVEECAHFFNLNGHLKNLSSVPIERPTWVDVQANGWDCGVHVINHMRRSDFMDSSSTPSHWDSTAIRHKLAIELLLDDENSEKAIILDKVQNHAKIKRRRV